MKVKLSKITQNFMALVGSNFGVQLLRFLTVALLARRLGNELFGVYNYIVLLVGFGFTLVEFGLKNLAIREISQGRGSRKLLVQIIKIRLALALIGVVLTVLFSGFAFPGGRYLVPSIFLALSLCVDALIIDFVVISHEKLVAQGLGNIAQALFLYVACFFLVTSSSDFVLLTELFLLSHVALVSVLFFAGKPWSRLPVKAAIEARILQTALAGLPFLVAQFLGGIQYSMDLLLLGQFHFDSYLGDYSAALKILGITLGIINALTSAVQPRLARESHNLKSEEMKALTLSTTRLIWILLVPTVVGSWLFGQTLVIWFFGNQFAIASEILKPLSIALALFCLGLPPMHALFLSHQTKLMIRIAVTNTALSFLVIAGVLFAGRPELVAWGMILVQGVYLLQAWQPVRAWGFLTKDDFALVLPTALMILPLIMSGYLLTPAIQFSMSAFGYALGLWSTGFWKKAWFKKIVVSEPVVA